MGLGVAAFSAAACMLLLSKAHSQGSPHNPSQLHTFPSLSLSLPFSGSQPFVGYGYLRPWDWVQLG